MDQINLSYDFDDKMQILQLILLDNTSNNLSQSETIKDFTTNIQEINMHGQNVGAQEKGFADGDQDFLSKVFDDQDKENFETYLEAHMNKMDGINQQTANFENKNIWASNKNNNYKKKKEGTIVNKQERVPKQIRYREVNRSPRTLFNYHGIDIQVLYQFYDSFHADCLVMPYSQISTHDLTKLGLNKSVISSIYRAYDSRTIQQIQENDGILGVNCKRNFKDHNYNWLYLFKKPYFKYIEQYSIKKLEAFVSFTLEKVCKYKSNESLAFPDFEWLGINCSLKCEVFFSMLTKAIFEQQKKRKLNLKKISVCCSTKQSFFSFNTKLRQLSDIYMFNEMVPLVRSWTNK